MQYLFIYSVDTITVSGKFETFGMILDHDELHDIANSIINSGSRITSVIVAMYDKNGELLAERDITRLFVPTN